MTKIVILGSCRFEPYEILFAPHKIPGMWNTKEGYKKASEECYPAIDQCDEVWVYVSDGIGKHTGKDIAYAAKQGKKIRLIEPDRNNSSFLKGDK